MKIHQNAWKKGLNQNRGEHRQTHQCCTPRWGCEDSPNSSKLYQNQVHPGPMFKVIRQTFFVAGTTDGRCSRCRRIGWPQSSQIESTDKKCVELVSFLSFCLYCAMPPEYWQHVRSRQHLCCRDKLNALFKSGGGWEGNLGLTSKLTQMKMPEAQLLWDCFCCSTKYTVSYSPSAVLRMLSLDSGYWSETLKISLLLSHIFVSELFNAFRSVSMLFNDFQPFSCLEWSSMLQVCFWCYFRILII